MIRTSFISNLSITAASAVFLLIVVQSCYYDVEEELYPDTNCDLTVTTYSEVVLPIIDNKCLGCHSAQEAQGGIALEPYAQLKVFADNGDLSCVINHSSSCSAMPKNAPKLSDCDINKIETWIANGANDN